MTARSDYEAAYFTLLRAREEATALRRYEEYLRDESRRLDTFSEALTHAGEPIDRKVRRPVDATAKATLEAVGRRRAVVLSELAKLPDRQSAADDFVLECEGDLGRLR